MRFLRFAFPAAALGLLILLTTSDAPAGCTTGGLWASPPPGKGLAVNGRIVLEGSGRMAPSVAALDSTGLVLVSDAEEIPLRVETIYVGRWNVAEAVLVPEREPAAGKQFVLRASTTAKGSEVDLELQRDTRMKWTSTASAPEGEVHWSAAPKRGEATITSNCPPRAYVSIHVPFDHPEKLLGVLAEVRPIKRGGTTSRFLITSLYDGAIALGALGCDEPIEIFPGVIHTVKLTAIDLAGREIPAPGGALAITMPREPSEPR